MTARRISAAERAYRLLLHAYPPSFRGQFGRDMQQLFRDRLREPDASMFELWADMLWDVAHSAPGQRLAALRNSSASGTHSHGGIMRVMAILSLLIGIVEVVNAMVEVRYGLANGSSGTGALAVGCVGVVAGVMLAVAGLALLRRSHNAVRVARAGAAICLAIFALVLLVQPTFSIFASLLGIGFPILLLALLMRSRADWAGPSMA